MLNVLLCILFYMRKQPFRKLKASVWKMKWIYKNADLYSGAVLRKWFMLHLILRWKSLHSGVYGLLLEFIYHNEIYCLVWWVLSNKLELIVCVNTLYLLYKIFWPLRFYVGQRKESDEKDKTKEMVKRKEKMGIYSLWAYTYTLNTIRTKVNKVRVHLAQIPVTKATKKTTDVIRILRHTRFVIIQTHKRRHGTVCFEGAFIEIDPNRCEPFYLIDFYLKKNTHTQRSTTQVFATIENFSINQKN